MTAEREVCAECGHHEFQHRCKGDVGYCLCSRFREPAPDQFCHTLPNGECVSDDPRDMHAGEPAPAKGEWRTCEFCGCLTDAKLRACCDRGRATDAPAEGAREKGDAMLPDSELARIEVGHYRVADERYVDVCCACPELWPCDTIKLVAALREARQEIKRIRSLPDFPLDAEAMGEDFAALSDELTKANQRAEAAERECEEQARLNGKGAQREAKLMARLAAAESERDALREDVEELRRSVAQLLDQDEETWPIHGNWGLAIAASIALLIQRCEKAEAVVEAAREWWNSKRPLSWTKGKHRENPTVNTSSLSEQQLALALAALDAAREGKG